MKTLLFGTILLLTTIFLAGCASASHPQNDGNSSPQNAYHRISPEEAHQLLQKQPDILLIDVRTPAEYTEKHIPGARLIPNEDINDQPLDNIDKEQPILLYCRTGHRSKQAADKLLQMGYTHIYDMEGGITAWPYETESEVSK